MSEPVDSAKGAGDDLRPTDSVLLPRFVMRRAIEWGMSPEQVSLECGFPGWSTAADGARIDSERYLRAWETAEHGLGDPDIAMIMAERYVVGELGLYDYLFSTAATLGDGLSVCGPFIGAISTNFRFDPGPESETEVAFDVTLIDGAGRGRELAMQFALAAIFTRTRLLVVDGPVNPARVAFRQRAPRHHDRLVETFGTTEIEFGAPADTVVFHAADLNLPMRTADSRLAEVLRRFAATLPPPTRPTTWLDTFVAALTAALDRGPVTLDQIARDMLMSSRSLQRRLAEYETSWRDQLDRARRKRYEKAVAEQKLTRSEQAALLGYHDSRSARRAAERWSS
ncbi:AraC family transcriptional regulator ligand-binding domain-containing protein [Nocardia sp. alder85J]|uniref:AraC family transcriptional regulator ligand-binding domain-containing protein n=1 Tax=Nocardia sp. alder85J TaxID=2862949 RepID=UPI001CD5509D|nr:AraC family transcriptional regulator ligand-binding domain-containing protein [Nocardia sp. alder85J]MCX4092159.1 AraC family transcriptional regulator ligand-binding domain-containing protein [Nocardia sp. alder85J]